MEERMSQTTELSNDLREIIVMDEAARVGLIFNGKSIIGTKGDLISAVAYDRDGGGLNYRGDFSATFVLSDFPTPPVGQEIVFIDNSVQKRILNVKTDDLNVAVVLDFASPNEE